MALSQKHRGKFIVPWFNTDEWKYVYDLIYSSYSEEPHKREALSIIRMWKTRTPLLQSGLEGTLCILHAMLPESNISEESLQMIQSSAIMRFLNICVGGHGKQTTLYEMAKKNNIPDWIISIRHNFAHDQKLASVSMLRSALEFSMQWLKTSYWDFHRNKIKDCVSSPQCDEKQIVEVIDLYCKIAYVSYKNENVNNLDDLDEATVSDCKKLAHIAKGASTAEILQQLWNANRYSYEGDLGSRIFVAKTVARTLTNNRHFLDTSQELEGGCFAGRKFLNAWCELIGVLSKRGDLMFLVGELHGATFDENRDENEKLCCAAWLNELFKNLRLFQKNKKLTINFCVTNELLQQLNELEDGAIKNANKFTPIFIKNLLLLNGRKIDYVAKIEKIIADYTQTPGNADISELPSQIPMEINSQREEDASNGGDLRENGNASSEFCRWKLVKDPSIFKGCTLGMWPGQQRDLRFLKTICDLDEQ